MTRKAFHEAPAVETECLVLRGYRIEDFPHGLYHRRAEPPVRVAEKCGYREFARSQYKGSTVVMLERF